MKRCVALFVILAVVVVFSLPAAAFAEKPEGVGKSAAPGQTKKTEAADAEHPGKGKANGKQPSESDAAEPDKPADEPADEPPGKAKGKGKTKKAEAATETTGAESPDASATVEPKRTGIENALDRIAANIARAEQKVAEGTKTRVPPGLLGVYEKFLGWLGLDAEMPDGDAGPGETPDEGEEETMTPEPGEGTSSTIQPEGVGG